MPPQKKKPLPEEKPTQEESRSGHPSSDRSSRFALDHLIRRAGCVIWQRKRGKEPIWVTPDGKKVEQSRIVKKLPKHMVEDAAMLEEMYLDIRFPLPKEVKV